LGTGAVALPGPATALGSVAVNATMTSMAAPLVVAVAARSAAEAAGVRVGDTICSMNGRSPRDVIEFQVLSDEEVVELELERGGLLLEVTVKKHAGEPLGVEVSSPVFDKVRTCDNHCAFCFIYQLPKGLRRSLYVKDDDYRLSFLYGNFTTLTRFTELDLERVVTERLSPLNVSIHTTDPDLRAKMLRNRRGATSLRWLRQLLDHGIEVHGQIVVCPGVNDGAALHETFAGILERFPELASVSVVPLGVSRYSREPELRCHSKAEAVAVVEATQEWQARFKAALGRRVLGAADEYYLLADLPFPKAETYEGFPQHENGVGMAASFAASFASRRMVLRRQSGFFQAVDAAPAFGYRSLRALPGSSWSSPQATGATPTLITGTYGARVLRPLLDAHGYGAVEIVAVENDFFGGNVAVAGLLSGADVGRALSRLPEGGRYLLPDVCLSKGRFLDGVAVEDLPRPVEVVETDGAALRRVLEADSRASEEGDVRRASAHDDDGLSPARHGARPLGSARG
jgi:putative radical SAM enzyme (TIGR03279 family)